MGMYTEIYTRIELKEDTPESVIQVLKFMLGEIEDMPALPDHALFKTPRWDFMLRCHSFYHIPFSNQTLKYSDIGENYYLFGRSDLKNYDEEIEKFFDWIHPYCEHGGMIGYSLYEEDTKPTLYFIDENGKIYSE